MDADLIKSILSVIAAFIPLIIATIALIRGRAVSTTIPNDSPSLKILKIKREPVEQKAWKQFKFGQSVINFLWAIPGYILYVSLFFYIISGQIKNVIIVVIINCIFGTAYVLVSHLISRMLSHDYISSITDAYNGRYFLFKGISVEIEADYYYLFNKCHEALKSLSYPVVEIDADSGVLEASFAQYHFHYSNDAGLIKVKINQKNEKRNTYIVSIDIEMYGTRHVIDTLASFSNLANRFVNQLISRPKNTAQEVSSQ